MAHTRRPLDWGWGLGVCVFATAAGFGALAIVGARSREVAPVWLAAALVVGLLLGWLGLILVRRSISANRAILARNRRARAYPDEPWRWLPEWEGCRSVQSDPHFGTTVLELRTLPVRVGGRLEGTIQTSLSALPAGGFDLRLVVQHSTRSAEGKSGPTVASRVLWEAQPTSAAAATPSGVSIEIALAIPADLPETNDSNHWSEVHWYLGVAATVDGRHYRAHFTLPVFSVEATPEGVAPTAVSSGSGI